eukprot:scaffold495_cov243-Pinguiococcus_pyrenoidosus.AAC.11
MKNKLNDRGGLSRARRSMDERDSVAAEGQPDLLRIGIPRLDCEVRETQVPGLGTGLRTASI